MSYALTLLIGLLAAASSLDAQVLSGTLLDAAGRAPVPGGVVTLLQRDSVEVARAAADGEGAFAFALPRGGTYRLRAEQAGFGAATTSTLSVGPRDTLHVELSVSRSAVELEPLVVTARTRRLTVGARGFYERAESRAFGTFITRQEIDRVQPHRTSELFRRIPGVWMSAVGSETQVTVRGSCRPSVFVDGVRVNEYRSIDDLTRPRDLEGIEVYRGGHQLPPEFTGTKAGCAVILLWSRIT